MEKLYRVKNNSLDFPALNDITRVQVGEIYNITYMIESGEFKGKPQARMYEYNSKTDTNIITNSEGKKAFAIASNDCIRDNFPHRCLARIVLEEGQYILRAVNTYSHANKQETTTIIIMKVVEVLPKIMYSITPTSVNVKILNKFVYDPYQFPKLGILDEAYQHLTMVHLSGGDFSEFLMPKYCFNPGRITTNRLFIQQEDGDLISYLDNGKKLILNKKSFARFEDPNDPNSPVRKSVFLRCFFPRIHQSDNIIFVEGAPLDMVDESDIAEYIRKSKLSDEEAVTSIKQMRRTDGTTYFAIVSYKESVFRPIYRTLNGFGTFPLNEYEKRMNDAMYDISLK